MLQSMIYGFSTGLVFEGNFHLEFLGNRRGFHAARKDRGDNNFSGRCRQCAIPSPVGMRYASSALVD